MTLILGHFLSEADKSDRFMGGREGARVRPENA